MERQRKNLNVILWVGFLVVLIGALSYKPFFARFPSTRDVPWVNMLIFVVGIWLMGVGLKRAFQKAELYRGRVFGTVVAIAGVVVIGYSLLRAYYLERQLPVSINAPRVGQKAPDFTLLDTDGNSITLSKLPASPADAPASSKTNGVVLIFYRGHW
jgi:hypothetical protein